MLLDKSKEWTNFFDVSKQRLSQKVIIPEIGVGLIPTVVYLLNVNEVAMKFLYVIKQMLRLIYENYKKFSWSIFYVLSYFIQI